MEKSQAFVIMPFSGTETCTEDEWTDIYENVHKPALEGCGYSCERASPQTGSLIKTIIGKLRNAWLVLADITDNNPNVFYELGVRHALSTRTIIAAQDMRHVPSDLRGYWSIVYNTKPGGVAKFRADVRDVATQIEASPEESDNPVSDYLGHEFLGVENYLQKEKLKKLGALLTELSGVINTLKEIPKDERYKEFLTHEALGLLLNTLYLDVGLSLLKKCHELRHNIVTIKTGLRLDSVTIERATALTQDVFSVIGELRLELLTGRYVEPSDVSTTIWTPTASMPKGDEIADYSVADDFASVDVDKLKAYFNNDNSK